MRNALLGLLLAASYVLVTPVVHGYELPYPLVTPQELRVVTSDFGPRDRGGAQFHPGLDLRTRVNGVPGSVEAIAVAEGEFLDIRWGSGGAGWMLDYGTSATASLPAIRWRYMHLLEGGEDTTGADAEQKLLDYPQASTMLAVQRTFLDGDPNRPSDRKGIVLLRKGAHPEMIERVAVGVPVPVPIVWTFNNQQWTSSATVGAGNLWIYAPAAQVTIAGETWTVRGIAAHDTTISADLGVAEPLQVPASPWLTAGETIAMTGGSGGYVPHLHLEAQVGEREVSPLLFIPRPGAPPSYVADFTRPVRGVIAPGNNAIDLLIDSRRGFDLNRVELRYQRLLPALGPQVPLWSFGLAGRPEEPRVFGPMGQYSAYASTGLTTLDSLSSGLVPTGPEETAVDTAHFNWLVFDAGEEVDCEITDGASLLTDGAFRLTGVARGVRDDEAETDTMTVCFDRKPPVQAVLTVQAGSGLSVSPGQAFRVARKGTSVSARDVDRWA